MMNDLRQRRKEDQLSCKSIPNESKQPNISRYKTVGQYVIIFGLIIVSSVILFTIINHLKFLLINDETSDDKYYPSEILHLFRKYDRNDDNYLSLDEFEAIAFQFNNKKVPTDYIQPILNSDQSVTMNAFFEPLNFSTMAQNSRYTILVC
jgi:hypothetical protein